MHEGAVCVRPRSFLLELEEEWRVRPLPGVADHDEVGMGVVLEALHGELFAVVRMERLGQEPLHVGEAVPAAVAEEEREAIGDRREVVRRRRGLPAVPRVVVVVLGDRAPPDHCFRLRAHASRISIR
jgi:hypothetical protein